MAQYLSTETLRDAVSRLGQSLAKGSVTDYLIFRRALKNARAKTPSADSVVTGLGSAPFQAAIAEFTACAGPGLKWSGEPHFSPFGSARDRSAGYKSAKYGSNGPSDTIAGWQSRSTTPIQVRPGKTPKEYTFLERSAQELEEFFLSKSKDAEKPRLLDAASWWFRSTDLEARLKAAPTAEKVCEAFVSDGGFTATEIAALFDALGPEDAPLTFDTKPAEPATYLPPAPGAAAPRRAKAAAEVAGAAPAPVGTLSDKVGRVCDFLAARGYTYEPWQVAAYITAVRTKPFVILAGISGTGKSRLPRLVAAATGAEFVSIAVRPDWTDSSELLGFERIDRTFIPGTLLQVARDAQKAPAKQFFVLLEEMNIARVEQYLAEVLSRLEERQKKDGRLISPALTPGAPDEWRSVGLPENLCIVGAVNMDETTHGFSRKVLDRSFVIEFSDVDLERVGEIDEGPAVPPMMWEPADWREQYVTLAECPQRAAQEVKNAIDALVTINEALTPAQLQVGYRVRDEVALFCLNARQCPDHFVSSGASTVDPLDLALMMKVLPRVQGGGELIRQVLARLAEWASPAPTVDPTAPEQRSFPLCAKRIAMMRQRLAGGFTSYWL